MLIAPSQEESAILQNLVMERQRERGAAAQAIQVSRVHVERRAVQANVPVAVML
jgi:hypothetical protein